MRVLIDLTSLDDNFTGIEHYALYLTKELVKDEELDFHLVFKNKVKYFTDEELKQKNITYKVLEGSRKKILLFSLSKYIDKYKPDYALFLAFPPSIFWKPKKPTKVISMIHDMVAFDCPETMKFVSKVYFKKSIKHAFKISDSFLTNSQFSKSRILYYNKSLNPDLVHVAYCASCMESNKVDFNLLKEKYSLPNKYLLALSTLEPRKNFDALIKWLDGMWDKKTIDLDLVVVGRKGWKVDEILKDIKNIDRIHFTGFVDEDDISSIYRYSTCFIFPSIYEGFGIPILESIISHKLPLCSSIDSFKEILGDDYPYYFDYKDGNDFENKLNAYLNDSDDKKETILNNVSSKISVFDWKKSADVVKDLFK